MTNNKVFLLLPDGIGLRNFAYTDFYEKGRQMGFDLTFWNNTSFDISSLGFKEIRIVNPKMHPLTDVFKKARVQIDLNENIRRSNDPVYDSYRFPFASGTLVKWVKTSAIKALTALYSSEKGAVKIRKYISKLEKQTPYYRECLETLKREKPALVFCTNQRTVSALAPMLAAQELGIPTATFIFSWDNLPKATLVLEPDYYFVWSDYMKNELLQYYPFIKPNQVMVTGTPQFETHTYRRNLESRADFFRAYGLDPNKKYICYSGDDVTTSPDDPQYLADTADAVRQLNKQGHDLGILFRRCPVDFSNRYDAVLAKNADILTAVDPKWKKMGDYWNTVLPTTEDLDLQVNTIAHTEMVINLGSSMVFDYISYDKPCAYINYDVSDSKQPGWSVAKIYRFVHFRSMPSRESVLWIDSPQSIVEVIRKGLNDSGQTVREAKRWFERINQHPPQDASSRIWQTINQIIDNPAVATTKELAHG
ncbi:MAG TPA: UDP-glycosyltransferase [Flavobacterium sp.]|nr:UDP-glycosyltransferase [Flavobacterium sp.]HPJ08990.1 UDP-glycosyltransferase [Flavobacterium sp.]